MAIDQKITCEQTLTQQIGAFTSERSFEIEEGLKFIGKAVFCIDVAGWLPGETLTQYIQRCVATPSRQNEEYRLPRSFNARNITKVARINIQWSTLLNDHLDVTADDSDVAVFQCYSVLNLYDRSPRAGLFPSGFIAETMRTLGLLLPDSDQNARMWLDEEYKKIDLDPALRGRPHLRAADRRIHEFDFWRDRLVIVKEVYDECEPRGLLQFLRDDRKPVQYWTFWVAVFAFSLSFIACMEGAMQVYKAYHPSAR